MTPATARHNRVSAHNGRQERSEIMQGRSMMTNTYALYVQGFVLVNAQNCKGQGLRCNQALIGQPRGSGCCVAGEVQINNTAAESQSFRLRHMIEFGRSARHDLSRELCDCHWPLPLGSIVESPT